MELLSCLKQIYVTFLNPSKIFRNKIFLLLFHFDYGLSRYSLVLLRKFSSFPANLLYFKQEMILWYRVFWRSRYHRPRPMVHKYFFKNSNYAAQYSRPLLFIWWIITTLYLRHQQQQILDKWNDILKGSGMTSNRRRRANKFLIKNVITFSMKATPLLKKATMFSSGFSFA